MGKLLKKTEPEIILGFVISIFIMILGIAIIYAIPLQKDSKWTNPETNKTCSLLENWCKNAKEIYFIKQELKRKDF